MAYETGLTKISNAMYPMIEKQLEENNIEMGQYSKQCTMNAITAINNVLDTNGVDWNDEQLDKNNITEILLSIASLEVNPSANPREVYFQLRRQKKKVNGKDQWSKKIEMGIEGDGNDAILARFGRNVKKIAKIWQVRENDGFQYPKYKGLEMESPEWEPTGKGKVIRVVYPIITNDDIVEFHIAERADVVKNLIAHINNNLMNETFGIAESRFKATDKQKQEINAKKQEIIDRAEELGLDATLDDEEMQKHISPAWSSPQSKESMIIRKMRNNIVKKIPKDFGNTAIAQQYEEQENEAQKQRVRNEINEQANDTLLDIDGVEEPKQDDKTNTDGTQGVYYQYPNGTPEQEGKAMQAADMDEIKAAKQERTHDPETGEIKEAESVHDDDIPF